MSVDKKHLALIEAIIDALPDDTDLAHALVALEDAYVTCEVGLTCRLSVAEVKTYTKGVHGSVV